MHKPTTTPAQRLAEIERELGMKRQHYPGWYRDKKLAEATGQHRIACFVDVIEDLKRLYQVPAQASLFDDTAAPIGAAGSTTTPAAAPATPPRPVSADKPRSQWD